MKPLEKLPAAPSSFDYELGSISISNKDTKLSIVQFDRMAVLHDKLMYVSLVAEKGRIKQVRAILATAGKGTTIEASGPKLFRAEDLGKELWKGRTIGRLYPDSDGYTMQKHDLDFNLAHAVFIARDPGFMLVMSKLALFKQIKRSTIKNPITTPFIPEWLDFMEQKLREQCLLEECYCYRCSCGYFSAGSIALESTIKEGLEKGEITIPPPPSFLRSADHQLAYVPNPVV